MAIETKDHVLLDSTHMSARNFQQKCIEAGAATVKLRLSSPGSAASEICGLVIHPQGETTTQFLDDLD